MMHFRNIQGVSKKYGVKKKPHKQTKQKNQQQQNKKNKPKINKKQKINKKKTNKQKQNRQRQKQKQNNKQQTKTKTVQYNNAILNLINRSFIYMCVKFQPQKTKKVMHARGMMLQTRLG